MDLVVGDILVVLGGDEDGVHAHGDHGATLLLVLHGHLGLPVGAQPRHAAVLAHLGQLEPVPPPRHPLSQACFRRKAYVVLHLQAGKFESSTVETQVLSAANL